MSEMICAINISDEDVRGMTGDWIQRNHLVYRGGVNEDVRLKR